MRHATRREKEESWTGSTTGPLNESEGGDQGLVGREEGQFARETSERALVVTSPPADPVLLLSLGPLAITPPSVVPLSLPPPHRSKLPAPCQRSVLPPTVDLGVRALGPVLIQSLQHSCRVPRSPSDSVPGTNFFALERSPPLLLITHAYVSLPVSGRLRSTSWQLRASN